MEATVIKDDINSRIELVDKGLVKQHIRTARSSEQVRAMAEVVRFCHLNGAKVPEIVKVEGRFVYTKFVRGEQYFGSQKELKSLARELALLHNCLLACPIQYNWRPGEVSYRLERFRPKKVQLIHGDMQPTNVLFSRRAVAVILDFGAMRKGEPIQDIAFAAFRFGKSRQAINQFLRAYVLESGREGVDFLRAKEYFMNETRRRVRSLKTSKEWAVRPKEQKQELKKQMYLLRHAHGIR